MSKIAVVTGGAGGIGQAVAERFFQEKYILVLLDLNDAAGKSVAAELSQRGAPVMFLPANLTQEAEVKTAFEKIIAAYSRVDTLVNVAGGSLHRHPLEDFPLAHWRAVIDANLTSTFLCCRAVVPGMIANHWGRIVNLASIAGKEGYPLDAAYCAAKAGVIAFTKSLAKEVAPHNIRVNAVAPTVIETDLVKGIPADEIAAKQRLIPLGRFGTPEEVAALIRFLVSDESSFITGQCSDISGGRATY